MVLITASCIISPTSIHRFQALCLSDQIPRIYSSLPLYNLKGFDLGYWLIYLIFENLYFSIPSSILPIFLPPFHLETTNFSLYLMSLFLCFRFPHVRDIIWYLFSPNLFCVAQNAPNSSILLEMKRLCSYLCQSNIMHIPHIFFTHSSVDEYLGYFYISSIVNNGVVSMRKWKLSHVQLFVIPWTIQSM